MKICTKCNKKLPLSSYHKQKRGKFGLRAVCKKCSAEYRKIYTSTPEFKEKHRLKMLEWRKKNPEKALEVSRRSFLKNGAKHNKKRRERYWNDPDYMELIKERERKYKASGRRAEMHRRRHILKAVELRQKSAEWKKNNPEKAKKYYKQYRKDVWIYKERKFRNDLDDRYVIMVIKKSLDYKIKTKDIPKELIDLERTKILIHRKLKNLI